MSYRRYFIQAIGMTIDLQHKNDEKIQECIDKYWDACKYPRKKKKRIRKQANKDYAFWMGMKDFLDNNFMKI